MREVNEMWLLHREEEVRVGRVCIRFGGGRRSYATLCACSSSSRTRRPRLRELPTHTVGNPQRSARQKALDPQTSRESM